MPIVEACWRHRPARNLIAADFASMIGDYMVLTAMPFAVLAIGGGGAAVGLVLAAQAAALAPFLLLGGVVGDRLPRRSVMVAADVLRFGSQAVIAALLLSGSAAVWQLVLAQLLHGIGTGLFMPSAEAVVRDVSSDVGSVNAAKQAERGMAGMAGPPLGALAVALAGPGIAMAADGVTFAVSALLLTRLPAVFPGGVALPSPPGPARNVGGALRRARGLGRAARTDLRDGLVDFWGRGWLRTVVLQFCLVNALTVAPFYVFGPIAAKETLGGVDAWAAILGALAGGELVGAVIAFKWRPRRPLVSGIGAFLLWGLPLVALLAGAPLTVLLACAFVAGVVQAAFAVLWTTTMQTYLPQDRLARLSSFDHFGGLVMVPLGFALGGVLEATVGVTAGLWIGIASLVMASLVALTVPSVRAVGVGGGTIDGKVIGEQNVGQGTAVLGPAA